MGTRSLTLVYYKGAWHIAQFGAWDGYPEGQGLTVLRFVTNAENVSKLKAVIDAGNIIYEPTAEQSKAWEKMLLEELNGNTKLPSDEEMVEKLKAIIDVSNIIPTAEQLNAWIKMLYKEEEVVEKLEAVKLTDNSVPPSANGCTAAKILDLVANATEPVPIVKELSWIAEPGICEWAYVVDLDEGALEVYSSTCPFLIKEGAETRFVEDGSFKDYTYLPDLVGKWMFDDLPNENDFLGWFKD